MLEVFIMLKHRLPSLTFILRLRSRQHFKLAYTQVLQIYPIMSNQDVHSFHFFNHKRLFDQKLLAY